MNELFNRFDKSDNKWSNPSLMDFEKCKSIKFIDNFAILLSSLHARFEVNFLRRTKRRQNQPNDSELLHCTRSFYQFLQVSRLPTPSFHHVHQGHSSLTFPGLALEMPV